MSANRSTAAAEGRAPGGGGGGVVPAPGMLDEVGGVGAGDGVVDGFDPFGGVLGVAESLGGNEGGQGAVPVGNSAISRSAS